MSDADQNYPKRNEAKRLFAEEFSTSTLTFQKQDEIDDSSSENVAEYHLLPSGSGANRALMAGTLTEVTQIKESPALYRARVVDETGTFYLSAGQYNPDAREVLRTIEAPQHIIVGGKLDSWDTDDGEWRMSLQPEFVTAVDKETRNRVTAEACLHTLDRLRDLEANPAQDGADPRSIYSDFDYDEFEDDVRSIVQTLLDDSPASNPPADPAPV